MCSILSTCVLNEITLQKKLQHFLTNNVILDKKVKTQQQQQSKHTNPCQNRESSPEPLAPQSNAIPLDLRVNLTLRLKSSYLTISVSGLQIIIFSRE